MFMFWYSLGLRVAYIKSPHPSLSPRAPLKHPQHSQWRTGEKLKRVRRLRLETHSIVEALGFNDNPDDYMAFAIQSLPFAKIFLTVF
jgi:hypothetical protein